MFRTIWIGLVLAGPMGCGDDDDDEVGGEGEEGEACSRDPSEDIETAVDLPAAPAEGEPNAEGYICPEGDSDYYRVSVEDGSLLRVQLLLESPLSPVTLTYNLFAEDGGALAFSGGTAPRNGAAPLTEVLCPAAGDYVLEVLDSSRIEQDFRHPYQLTVTTEPEPDSGEADGDRPIGLNSSETGLISCDGDIDGFLLDVPADTLLEVRLTSEIATYEPSYRVLDQDGVLLYQNQSLRGSQEATDIQGLYALPVAAQYRIEVFDTRVDDTDLRRSDADTAYTVEVTGHTEPDPNDRGTRNDVVAAATTIGTKSCGGSYQGETITGYFSAIGDVDWYRIPLSGCGTRGIVQVSVDATGTDGIDPQLRLVRPFPDKSCDRDEECGSLDQECDYDVDCAEFGNTCVGVQGDPERRDEDPSYQPGTCSGASTCIDGLCGATQFEKNSEGASIVATAQPLLDTAELYLVLQDFRSDASDLDTAYTVRIETRQDPDAFERDSVYNPYPFRFIDREINLDLAQPSGSAEAGFCVSGTIATEHDEDWFYYSSACPNQQDGVDACTINVDSDFEAGPVDFIVTVLRNGDDWFQPAVVDEAPSNGAISETYGPPGECFFAVEGDSGYHIVINDNRGEAQNPNPADWSDTQSYNVCFRPYQIGCNAPCQWIGPPEPGCNL